MESDSQAMDFEAARHNMVDSQIRPNRVTDKRLLAAFAEVPRERFVPEDWQSLAYVDEAVPMGGGRYLIEPMVLALLLDNAEIATGSVVLVVGCNSGYSMAVLSGIAGTVVGLESDPGFIARATENLADIGADNAVIYEGGLLGGLPKQAPFDVIVFDGAISRVPEAYAAQVAEGGRIVAVVQKPDSPVGRGTVFTAVGGRLNAIDTFDAGTPVLPGFEPEPEFQF